MNNVTSLSEIKSNKIANDFQKQEIRFDIDKLKNACNEVLKIKGFDTSLGIPHFAGISLNQIEYFVFENHYEIFVFLFHLKVLHWS